MKLGIIKKGQWGIFSNIDCLELLKRKGITVAESWWQGDWILGTSIRRLDFARRILPFKRYLVYAEDPRLDRYPCSAYSRWMYAPPIQVLNAFSAEMFWDNHYYIHQKEIRNAGALFSVKDSHFSQRDKKIAAAMAYSLEMQSAPAPPGGSNLHPLRVAIMKAAYKRGVGALQGGDWPPEFASKDTGYDAEVAGTIPLPWAVGKVKWLESFWFNLCYENTLAPHYVTEKIWHSLMAGCVPVYYGAGSTIAEDFPENSFVDGSKYDDPNHLIDYLMQMDETEAVGRLRLCLDAFSSSREKALHVTSYDVLRAEKLAIWLTSR